VKGPQAPLYYADGITPSFATPSGKIEFYSTQLRDKGFDRCRATSGPIPAARLVRLLYGRAPVHTFSRTQTNPILRDAMPENEVWVNAASALAWARERRLRAAAQPGRRAEQPRQGTGHRGDPPECVYMVHGFGLAAKACAARSVVARVTRSSSRATRPTR